MLQRVRSPLVSFMTYFVLSNAASARVDELPADGWNQVRAAIAAHQHRICATPLGHAAKNPTMRWDVLFDGCGFEVRPKEGDWTWGLQTISYGWDGRRTPVTKSAATCVDANQLSYVWDERLIEWFKNGEHGIEHGYTVLDRPAGTEGSLTLELGIRGALRAKVDPTGLDVTFVDEFEAERVGYRKLFVLDANGRSLPATLSPSRSGLLLAVDDRDSVYPLTIDPIASGVRLKANVAPQWATTAMRFGTSVAASGDTIVVGMRDDWQNAQGVDGVTTDIALTAHSGAAYVFVRVGSTWVQQAYLKPHNTHYMQLFGSSVAIDGDTIVIGAEGDRKTPSGVDKPNTGAIFVFTRSQGVWSQQAYIKASNFATNDEFGSSVGIFGDTIVAGAPREDSVSAGVNGNQFNDPSPIEDVGAGYVFVRSNGIWSQQAYLKPLDPASNDMFGASVGIFEDRIVISAPAEDSSAVGVNGNPFDTSASDSGAAYVFLRTGIDWIQEAYLKASNTGTGDRFGDSHLEGCSVAISGDTIVIGARNEDSNASGVNGDETNDLSSNAGAAYVFHFDGSVWSQQAYLKAMNPDPEDYFGLSVSIWGDRIVIGAPLESGSGFGVNSTATGNAAPQSGAAYLFARSGSQWIYQSYLKADNTGNYDYFGGAVTIHEDLVVVGATRESSAPTGVGSPDNNSQFAAGAAYTFSAPCGSTSTYGNACTGSGGIAPAFGAVGCASGNSVLEIQISNGLGGAATLFLASAGQVQTPVGGGCSLLVGPTMVVVPGPILPGSGAGAGGLAFPVGMPATTFTSDIWIQTVIADPGSSIGFTLTNGVGLHFL